MSINEYLLDKCLKRIEQVSCLGNSSLWKNDEFNLLSDSIMETTGVQLSVTTLKRIWGKVAYNSNPTITTLNALAKYIGYPSWSEFMKENEPTAFVGKPIQPVISVAKKIDSVSEVRKDNGFSKMTLFGVLIFTLLVASVVYFSNSVRKTKFNKDQFEFSSRKILTSGVPNTVIFDYDASTATQADSVFIQQSWDSRLRKKVYNQKAQHSSIYYSPGFFKAKLIVNGQIMKEHDITINTDGWLVMVKRKEEIPVYFTEKEAVGNGSLYLPLKKIAQANIPLQPDPPNVYYYYVKGIDSIRASDFVFETSFRNTYKEGAGICQNASISLFFHEANISIPFSSPGCVSDINLSVLGTSRQGKESDLSAFGCDFSSWVKLRCEVKNSHCIIKVNEKTAFEADLTPNRNSFSGMVFWFAGAGRVDGVKLGSAGRPFSFVEEFEQ